MQSFDIVMEKAYDADMESKMMDALNTLKNLHKSPKMKEAKSLLSEARSLAKKGSNKEAKVKYKETIKKIRECAQEYANAYNIIASSGDVKKVRIKYIVSAVIGLISWIAALLSSNSMKDGLTKANVGGFGLSMGTLISSYIFTLKTDRDNQKNHDAFVSKIKENPDKILLAAISDMSKMITIIESEMKALK